MKLSNYSFGVGTVLSNLRRIPILNTILELPVTLLWLLGYSTWYIGSLLHEKNHSRKYNSWYGFIEFKQQHLTSALLGTIATVICIFAPTMIVIPAWLFFISNVFWTIGSFHKQNQPEKHLDDHSYSTDKQTAYTHFTLSGTLLSLFTAITTTMSVVFPLSAPAILSFSIIPAAVLSIISLALLVRYHCGTFDTDHKKKVRLSQNSQEMDNIPPQQHLTKTAQPNCWSQCMPACFKSPIDSKPDDSSKTIRTTASISLT